MYGNIIDKKKREEKEAIEEIIKNQGQIIKQLQDSEKKSKEDNLVVIIKAYKQLQNRSSFRGNKEVLFKTTLINEYLVGQNNSNMVRIKMINDEIVEKFNPLIIKTCSYSQLSAYIEKHKKGVLPVTGNNSNEVENIICKDVWNQLKINEEKYIKNMWETIIATNKFHHISNFKEFYIVNYFQSLNLEITKLFYNIYDIKSDVLMEIKNKLDFIKYPYPSQWKMFVRQSLLKRISAQTLLETQEPVHDIERKMSDKWLYIQQWIKTCNKSDDFDAVQRAYSKLFDLDGLTVKSQTLSKTYRNNTYTSIRQNGAFRTAESRFWKEINKHRKQAIEEFKRSYDVFISQKLDDVGTINDLIENLSKENIVQPIQKKKTNKQRNDTKMRAIKWMYYNKISFVLANAASIDDLLKIGVPL